MEPEDITVQNFNDVEYINVALELAFKLKSATNTLVEVLNQSLDRHSADLLHLKPGSEVIKKTEELILYEEKELSDITLRLTKLNAEIEALTAARDLILSIDALEENL